MASENARKTSSFDVENADGIWIVVDPVVFLGPRSFRNVLNKQHFCGKKSPIHQIDIFTISFVFLVRERWE